MFQSHKYNIKCLMNIADIKYFIILCSYIFFHQIFNMIVYGVAGYNTYFHEHKMCANFCYIVRYREGGVKK